MHKRTDSHLSACQDRYTADCRNKHMYFIVSVAIVLIAVRIIPRMRMPGGEDTADLGWVSEQWLSEHRASHSL